MYCLQVSALVATTGQISSPTLVAPHLSPGGISYRHDIIPKLAHLWLINQVKSLLVYWVGRKHPPRSQFFLAVAADFSVKLKKSLNVSV